MDRSNAPRRQCGPHGRGVRVEVPKETAYGLSQAASGSLDKNFVGKRDLRKFAGQASFIAGLVPLLRPFLSGIWAALKEPVTQKGPVLPGRMRAQAEHVVWTRQVERSLRWVRAFLEGTAGAPLVRVVHLRDRKFDGTEVQGVRRRLSLGHRRPPPGRKPGRSKVLRPGVPRG